MSGPSAFDDDAPAGDIGSLLVHALELAYGSRAGYAQLADSMALHHNEEAASLFRILAAVSGAQGERIARRASGIDLPKIPVWQLTAPLLDRMPTGIGNEAEGGCSMTSVQAIELALANERHICAFYARVAGSAADADVRRLAAEILGDAAGHIAYLDSLLSLQRRRQRPPTDDWDPPHTPG